MISIARSTAFDNLCWSVHFQRENSTNTNQHRRREESNNNKMRIIPLFQVRTSMVCVRRGGFRSHRPISHSSQQPTPTPMQMHKLKQLRATYIDTFTRAHMISHMQRRVASTLLTVNTRLYFSVPSHSPKRLIATRNSSTDARVTYNPTHATSLISHYAHQSRFPSFTCRPFSALYRSPLRSADDLSSPEDLRYSGMSMEAAGDHKYTIIWLHDIAQPVKTLTTMMTILQPPNTKLIVPQAPKLPLTCLPDEPDQFAWFDRLEEKMDAQREAKGELIHEDEEGLDIVSTMRRRDEGKHFQNSNAQRTRILTFDLFDYCCFSSDDFSPPRFD